MGRSLARSNDSRSFVLLCSLTIAGVLYFAKPVLLPLAFAVLFSFLLAPLVNRVQRLRLGRVPAVIVVGTTVLGLGSFTYLLGEQLYEVAYDLPDYKANIVRKLHALQGGESSVARRFSSAVDEIRKSLVAHQSGRRKTWGYSCTSRNANPRR